MRLKQIRLAGFKSFIDRTTIPFPTDMTAIVGPNGCGKSNVIDAVRWVLGESNARNLRGGSMNDVIFNGSTKRAAVSKAMVELVFDNQQGRIGGEFASYAEIAVRREVTRDGQNNYLLNGAKCRKRDITDLFLGTGLGPRSYAIIEQGMISRLIESKPQELRVFIEEAAGVSKYKERRRETELRIKHSNENILRLRDIESELGQQVNKLKTQAQAAKRYRQYRERHRELKTLICLQELRQLDASIDGADQQHQQAEQQQALAEHAITQAENQLLLLSHQLSEQQELSQHLQGQAFELKTELAKLEQQQQHIKQLQSQSQQAKQRNLQQQSSIKQNLEHLEQQLEQQQQQLENVEQQQEMQQQLLVELEPQLEQAEQAYNQAQAELNAFASDSQQAKHRVAQLQSQMQHSQRLQQSHQQQLAQAQQGLNQLSGQTSDEIAQLQQRLADVKPQQQQSAQIQQTLTEQRQQLRHELQSAEQQLQQLKLQQAAEQTRLQGVEKLLSQFSRGAQLPLSEVIGVNSGWERAADTVLGTWLQAEWSENLSPEQSLALSAVSEQCDYRFAEPLRQLPSLASQLNEVELSFLCGQVLLVENLQQAFELRHYLSPEQSLITAKGEWLGKYWQQLSSSQYQHSLLSLQQEQQQLTEQLQQLEDAVGEQQQRQQSLAESEQALIDELERQTLLQQNFEKQTRQAQSRLALLEQQQQFAEQQREQYQQQLEELSILVEQEQEAQLLLEEQLEDAHFQQQQQLELQQSLSQQVELASQELKQLRQSIQQQQHSAHQQQLALQQQQAAIHTSSQQQYYQQQKLDELLAQLSQAPEQHQEELESLSEQIEQLLEQTLLLEELQSEAAQEHQQSVQLQQQQQQNLKQAQQHLQRLQQQDTEQRIQQQSLLARRAVLLEQLAEQGENLKHLELSLPEASLEDDYASELAQVDARLKRLGAVNLAAEAEFDQQNARYQELCEQLADLEAAIEVLQTAIAKIDRQTRSKFSETFAKVDADLQQLFPKVFGGGKAWLELSSDDLLETGVTIMARPPGKKNASISLLSGGEKALTALALVFAIFRLNPAPFCMLDEVDAPLDEVNVGRFADLVHSMSDSVQFIFISHNKVTMEKASQLAGVTMQEPGVSRLVAVDIEEAIAMVE